MRIYHVYSHPSGKWKAVKHGFSWPGFFFTFLWALFKSLWLLAVLVFAFWLAIQFAEELAGHSPFWWKYLLTAIPLFLCLAFGFWGNKWISISLVRRGYQRVATVEARTGSSAIGQALSGDPIETPNAQVRYGLLSPALAISYVVLILVLRFTYVAYYIPSPGMLDTLQINDRVFVNRIAYVFGNPERGDLVAFRVPEDIRGYDPDKPVWIQRVVGVEGDTVSIEEHRLLIDGKPASKHPFLRANKYIAERADGEMFTQEKIPDGRILVFGDNSGNSYDGRYWGPIEVDRVIGKVVYRFWPSSRFGPIHGVPKVRNPHSVQGSD